VAHDRGIQCPNLDWRKRCNQTVTLSKRRAQSIAVVLGHDAVLDGAPALRGRNELALQLKVAIAGCAPQKNNNPVN
jgi:hypothetical protein